MKAADRVERVAIIGNGLMGQGIAQVFARAGKAVTLIGRSEASLERAVAAIGRNVEAFVGRGLVDAKAAAATRAAWAPKAQNASRGVATTATTKSRVVASFTSGRRRCSGPSACR